jgi:hypothetical protein
MQELACGQVAIRNMAAFRPRSGVTNSLSLSAQIFVSHIFLGWKMQLLSDLDGRRDSFSIVVAINSDNKPIVPNTRSTEY